MTYLSRNISFRHNKRDQLKIGFANKANIVAKFLVFISESIDDNRKNPLSVDEFEAIINEYFHRFDEELEQITLKKEINKRRQNQHASRESVIKITIEKDQQNFNGGGIELPNLCDPVEFKKFQDWDGNSHNIQHLKMIFISKRILNDMRALQNVPETQIKMDE